VTYRTLACLLAAFAAAGCERNEASPPSALATGGTNESRAIVDSPAKPLAEAPLLLLDDDQESETATGPAADNSRCFVCHVNYMEEPIAENHARRNIGCARCHGDSDAHIADESWGSGGNGTAPDVMYPRDRVNPACMACHPQEKIDTPQHKLVFAASDPRVCTDCHGSHRLPQRRCKWR
jgi:hypothetical protein